MHEQLIQGLQDGIDKMRVELGNYESAAAELRQRILRNEGALMLALDLQKQAGDAEKAAAEKAVENKKTAKPLRSVETVAAERKSKEEEKAT